MRHLGIQYSCQKCHKEDSTTRRREIYTKDYVGPCADSFCYESCEMSICRPLSVTVCDTCAQGMSKPEPARPAPAPASHKVPEPTHSPNETSSGAPACWDGEPRGRTYNVIEYDKLSWSD